MTLSLTAIQTAMKGWVSAFTGVPLALCLMQNEARPFVPAGTGKGVAAYLSWVSISGIGADDVQWRVDILSPTSIVATGGVSSASPQTYSGSQLNGADAGALMVPARVAVLQLSASADWLATSATVTGLDTTGMVTHDTLAIPSGGNVAVSGSVRFASITSIALPSQGGVGGTFTLGTDVPVPDVNATPQTVTLRRMTLQIGLESFTQEPTDNAFERMESLRGFVYGPRSVALLAAANLGLVDMDATTQADYRVDDRWISRAVATVRLNQTDVTEDTAATQSSIERVQVSDDELTDATGTRVPTWLQWNAHEIP